MSNRTKKIIIIVGLGLVLLFAILALNGQEKKATGPGEGSSGMIYVDDQGKLHDMLFDQQYYAVEAAVSDYILAEVGPNVPSAKLVGEPTVPGNGLVEFMVQTTHPNRQFKVKLDRGTYFDKIIMTVEGTNYKKTLNVYQDPAPAETTYE